MVKTGGVHYGLLANFLPVEAFLNKKLGRQAAWDSYPLPPGTGQQGPEGNEPLPADPGACTLGAASLQWGQGGTDPHWAHGPSPRQWPPTAASHQTQTVPCRASSRPGPHGQPQPKGHATAVLTNGHQCHAGAKLGKWPRSKARDQGCAGCEGQLGGMCTPVPASTGPRLDLTSVPWLLRRGPRPSAPGSPEQGQRSPALGSPPPSTIPTVEAPPGPSAGSTCEPLRPQARVPAGPVLHPGDPWGPPHCLWDLASRERPVYPLGGESAARLSLAAGSWDQPGPCLLGHMHGQRRAECALRRQTKGALGSPGSVKVQD